MQSATGQFAGSRSARLEWLVAILCLSGGSAGVAARDAEHKAQRVLTRAADIRTLSVSEANRNYPVRLRAIVTYYDPQGPDLFVQDESAGIWVDTETARLNVAVSAGDLVELTGVTEQPDFAPEVGRPHVTILGKAPLPEPRRVSYQAMASTMVDSLRVEIEGIIQRVWKDQQDLMMDVAMDGGSVFARIPFYREGAPETLVSARVNLQGTCGTDFNANYQLVGVNLFPI